MQSRGKRGTRKKAAASDDESNESYNSKPKKRLSKKNAENKKKEILPRNKSKSKVELSSVDSFSDSQSNEKKIVKVPVEGFNYRLVYTQILNKANKQPEFLIMLKNLLSCCDRQKEEMNAQYRKKWKLLRNSNSCTQDEYLTRQNQLKRAEAEETEQIEQNIISKLFMANIKGFQTKQSIINNYKLSHANIDETLQYILDENQWQKYREEQKKLLQILMKESDFVSQDYKLINTKYVPEALPISNMSKDEQNQVQAKFNNLQTEQNKQSIQFLFCKNFNVINYDKVFECNNPFKVSEDEKYMVDSKAISWLLQSKCDQIYTNQHFQKETYNKYSKLLRDIYHNPEGYTELEIMNHVLESGAYILNSVHYYQKFKLKCDLLHPLDLLLVTDKLGRNIQSKEEGTNLRQENSSMEDENKKQNSSMVDEKLESIY